MTHCPKSISEVVSNNTGYQHIFDYWKWGDWDETEINQTLVGEYVWGLATDTSPASLIEEASAAFSSTSTTQLPVSPNVKPLKVIRFGKNVISRDGALKLVTGETCPRYESIKWYFDALGIEFQDTVSRINAVPKIFKYLPILVHSQRSGQVLYRLTCSVSKLDS